MSDTAMLRAVLRAAMTEPGRGEIKVDPRPFNDNDGLYSVSSEAVVTIPDSILRRRTAVINALGLSTVDATVVGQNARCPGVFVGVADQTPDRKDSAHAECPRRQFYVLAIGLPRAGTVQLPNGEVYDRTNVRAGHGYWAVRVIRTNMGPTGSSVHASDYVVQNARGKWEVVKVVGLMYTE
jgi:hypothetical protein